MPLKMQSARNNCSAKTRAQSHARKSGATRKSAAAHDPAKPPASPPPRQSQSRNRPRRKHPGQHPRKTRAVQALPSASAKSKRPPAEPAPKSPAPPFSPPSFGRETTDSARKKNQAAKILRLRLRDPFRRPPRRRQNNNARHRRLRRLRPLSESESFSNPHSPSKLYRARASGCITCATTAPASTSDHSRSADSSTRRGKPASFKARVNLRVSADACRAEEAVATTMCEKSPARLPVGFQDRDVRRLALL